MFDKETIAEQMRAHREWLDSAPGSWPAKRELSEALREVLDTISATDVEEAELLELAGRMRAVAERFRESATAHETIEREGQTSMVGGMETIQERSPLVGRSNPIAPPLEIEIDLEAEEVVGEVTFSRAYEGAPGCVHGGWVAAVLDEALGLAGVFSGGPAMTGELLTRFLRPTPIGQRLSVRARFDRKEGRRVETSGEVYAGEVRFAEATGIFVAVDFAKFAELRAQQRERDA